MGKTTKTQIAPDDYQSLLDLIVNRSHSSTNDARHLQPDEAKLFRATAKKARLTEPRNSQGDKFWLLMKKAIKDYDQKWSDDRLTVPFEVIQELRLAAGQKLPTEKEMRDSAWALLMACEKLLKWLERAGKKDPHGMQYIIAGDKRFKQLCNAIRAAEVAVLPRSVDETPLCAIANAIGRLREQRGDGVVRIDANEHENLRRGVALLRDELFDGTDDNENRKVTGTINLQTVTLNQMAGMVQRSKRTLEQYRSKLPKPIVAGRKGQPTEWSWGEVRPKLETYFNRELPERLPSDRLANLKA